MAAPPFLLQYPQTQADVRSFVPRVKRQLDIRLSDSHGGTGDAWGGGIWNCAPGQKDGPIAGKTGTCTETHTHLAGSARINRDGGKKLVVVVLLTGGRPAIGPLAAGIAGDVYKLLGEANYFASGFPSLRRIWGEPICCSR